ncbi:MAG: hypothetical protein WBP55_02520 [Solirubrobacterales bacterium]
MRSRKTVWAIGVVLAIAAGIAAGLLMSGEDRSQLFPSEDVAAITENIDEAEALAASGNCFRALKPAGEAQAQAENLSSSVDPALKRSLIDGVVRLVLRIGNQCEENPETGNTGTSDPVEPEPEVAPTGETGTTSDEKQTDSTEKKDKQPSEKPTKPTPDPKPTPEPVEPPTTTPPTPEPPVDTGPGSGGISPDQ